MLRITTEERRRRLAVRHHLAAAATAADVATAARSLIGLHGTDATSVFLSAAARSRRATVATIERALYDDRTIVRVLGMRRTVFVVPAELVGVVQAAVSDAIAVKERKALVRMIEEAGITKTADRWLCTADAATLAALERRGEATAADLAKDVPALREQMSQSVGKKYEGVVSVGSRSLFVLSTEGRIVRGRPRGSWLSTQYKWAPTASWLGAEVDAPTVDDARRDLVSRWLRAFGPATVADVKWWTGWTLGETRTVLAGIDVVEVDLDGTAGIALSTDLEPTKAPKPWAALLPALDPTVMGWTARDWYLGAHRDALFDRSGNAGPTIWWNGHVIGGWAQRASGEVVTRLLEDAGQDAKTAVAKEAERLEAWLGERRVTPRFRTPLERELTT